MDFDGNKMKFVKFKMWKRCTHGEAQRLACGTVKNVVKVQVCNLRLIDNIEQIGHSDADIEWSSDEHLDWLSGINTAFELFVRTLFFLNFCELFSNFVLNVSNFTTMSWKFASVQFSRWSSYWAEGTCWGASGTGWRRCTAWHSWLGTWNSQGHQLVWWTMSLSCWIRLHSCNLDVLKRFSVHHKTRF